MVDGAMAEAMVAEAMVVDMVEELEDMDEVMAVEVAMEAVMAEDMAVTEVDVVMEATVATVDKFIDNLVEPQ